MTFFYVIDRIEPSVSTECCYCWIYRMTYLMRLAVAFFSRLANVTLAVHAMFVRELLVSGRVQTMWTGFYAIL